MEIHTRNFCGNVCMIESLTQNVLSTISNIPRRMIKQLRTNSKKPPRRVSTTFSFFVSLSLSVFDQSSASATHARIMTVWIHKHRRSIIRREATRTVRRVRTRGRRSQLRLRTGRAVRRRGQPIRGIRGLRRFQRGGRLVPFLVVESGD